MTSPENATYTAAEVKVLTEAALRLGRKEAGEEIAVGIAEHRREFTTGSAIDTELFVAQEIALMVASQPSPDATSGRTDPKVDSDLPQDTQAGRGPQGDSNG